MQNPNHSEQHLSLGHLLRESINKGNNPSLAVISDSMAPLLKAGDQVELQKLEQEQLHRGNIVTYTSPIDPSKLVTHRVAGSIRVNDQHKIITWADRTLMFDLPIEATDIIGLVVRRTRKDQHLNLISGRGAWLSDKLSKLATCELRWITKLDLVQDELTEKKISDSDERRQRNKTKVSVRLLRRIAYFGASVLASMVDLLS